jgi:rubrerythrin
MSPHTRKNQLEAMHAEAFAIVKYTLFARQARKNGREGLAALFERTAQAERLEHFAAEAELAGAVGSDADNLRDAIQGESYEVERMCREFGEQAEAAGDGAAAARFAALRQGERAHRDAFRAALQQLEAPD